MSKAQARLFCRHNDRSKSMNPEQVERSRMRTLAQKIAHWKKTGDCDDCASLAHRRADPVCLVCGEPYADEDLTECRREAVTRRYYREAL